MFCFWVVWFFCFVVDLLILLFVCFACIYVCVPMVSRSTEVAYKIVLGPLVLDLEVVVSHHVGSVNTTYAGVASALN